MELVSLRTYLSNNPPMARPLLALMRESLEASSIQTRGDVTDDEIARIVEDPTSFWRVATSPDEPYRPVLGLVGLQKFNPVDGTGEIAVAVLPEYRRKGLGVLLAQAMRAWAVANLNLRKLVEFVVADSLGEKIALAQGDELVGTLKAYRFLNGRYADVKIYSWLREGG